MKSQVLHGPFFILCDVCVTGEAAGEIGNGLLLGSERLC